MYSKGSVIDIFNHIKVRGEIEKEIQLHVYIFVSTIQRLNSGPHKNKYILKAISLLQICIYVHTCSELKYCYHTRYEVLLIIT